MVNFKQPYFSRSLTEFWSRWHISLSTWFRDYLYIPLGGNKVSKFHWYFNLFLTFLISGLWHGASWTYIIWGSLHGFYLIMAIVFAKPITIVSKMIESIVGSLFLRIVNIFWTFILVSFAWIFFRASNFEQAWYIVSHIGVNFKQGINAILYNENNLRNHYLYAEKNKIHLFLCVFWVLSLLAFELINHRISITQYFMKKPAVIRWLLYLCFAALFAVFGLFESKQQFTYFQF